MAKKQKRKSKVVHNRDQNDAPKYLPKPANDHVCACIELAVKPPTKRGGSGSDQRNIVDNRYAAVHWSDAYKLDIHDGEPALAVRVDETDCSGHCVATICKVIISPKAPSGSTSSNIEGPSARRRNSCHDAAKCGDVILSPFDLYETFSPSEVDKCGAKMVEKATIETPSTSKSTSKESFVSPSKSNFSFSKGGGGDSFLSPSPSKYSSPSGSKFSFSKGGGGSSYLSPGKCQTPNNQSVKRAQAKVLLTPLANFSRQPHSRLCPDADRLLIRPMKDSKQFSSSTKIVQTLVLSKYQGTYVPAQSSTEAAGLVHAATNDEISSISQSISISYQGQTETFLIIGMTSVPIREKQTDLNHEDNGLSSCFDRLNISDQKNEETQEELKLLELIKDRIFGESSEVLAMAYRITPRTTVEVILNADEAQSAASQATPSQSTSLTKQTLCAGLDLTYTKIKDTLLPPLLHPNMFPADGPLRPPKGCLLFGPAGVGKSLLAAQLESDLSSAPRVARVHVNHVQCADVLSSTSIVGEGEKILTDIFQEAQRNSANSCGSLLILDDVHLICPRRGGIGGVNGGVGVDQLAGTLLALLDGIGSTLPKNRDNMKETSSGGGVAVLAITTDPSLLDPALRRPGRLDVEVEVPVPDDNAREKILRFHLSHLMAKHLIAEHETKTLARLAKGFTGADCKLAVKEAVRTAASRALRAAKFSDQAGVETGPNSLSGAIIVEYADMEHAIRVTKPSAIKSVAVEVPRVPWSAIGGMDHVKALLKESIELPLTHPHLFELMQVPPPKGILLYGPPGCSKTLMARAIATEGNMNFLAVKGPELLSKWLGESERALASLFRRARLATPAVIFFDEIDAIASKRGDSGGSGGDRLLSQLLTELDGVTSGGSFGSDGKSARVVVVGATNRPDVLDAALTRPGRMDRMIYVGLPDEQGRESIFRIGLSGKDCNKDVDVLSLARISDGYSGAEIIALCRDAALYAIGEMDDGDIDTPQVHMRHLVRSINGMKPRTTPGMLQFYECFRGRR